MPTVTTREKISARSLLPLTLVLQPLGTLLLRRGLYLRTGAALKWASLIPPWLLLLAVGHPYFPVIDPSSEPAANACCYAVGASASP